MKPKLMIDWDGTLVENKWPGEGDWLPGAKKALKKLTKKYHVFIYSARTAGINLQWTEALPPEKSEKEFQYIRTMLDNADLEEVDIFLELPLGSPKGKPTAIAYIDDRAIRFEGNWPRTLRQLSRIGG